MLYFLIIWAVEAAIAVGIATGPRIDEISAHQLAQLVAGIERDHAQLDTEFEIWDLGQRPADEIAAKWNREQWETYARIRWLSDGERQRIEHLDRSATDPRQLSRHVWNGQTFSTRVERHFVIDRHRRWPVTCEWGPLFNQSTGHAFVCDDRLSESIRRGIVLSQQRSGSTLRHRYKYDLDWHLEYEVTLELEPEPRVVEFIVDHISDDPQESRGGIRTRRHFRVLDWQEYGNATLPSTASMDVFFLDDQQRWMVRRELYERKTATVVSAELVDSREFSVVPDRGMNVSSNGLNVSLVAGMRRFTVDGIAYLAPTPLDMVSTDSLGQLVARSVDRPRESATVGASAAPRIFAALGTAIAVLVMIVILRVAFCGSNSRRMRVVAGALAVVLFVCGASVLGYGWPVGDSAEEEESAITGAKQHNFGEIRLPKSGKQVLSHEFQLHNRSGRAIRVRDTRADCSCAVVSSPDRLIDNGEAFAVGATMEVEGIKPRTATIWLDLGLDKPVRLTLSARGALPEIFQSVEGQVTFGPSVSSREVNLIYVSYLKNDAPGTPEVVTPPQAVVTVGEWQRVVHRRLLRDEVVPARWHCKASVSCEGLQELPAGSLVKFSVNSHSTQVRVRRD